MRARENPNLIAIVPTELPPPAQLTKITVAPEENAESRVTSSKEEKSKTKLDDRVGVKKLPTPVESSRKEKKKGIFHLIVANLMWSLFLASKSEYNLILKGVKEYCFCI